MSGPDPSSGMGADGMGLDAPEPGFPGAEEPEERQRRRPTVRGALVIGARTTSGLIGVAASVAVVIAAATIPLPTWSVTPASVVVTPEAAASRLVCTGSPLRLADESGEGAGTSSPLVTPVTTVVGDGSVDVRSIAQSDAGTGGTDDAPVVLEIAPGADGAPRLDAGAQASLIADGDQQGLATQTCAAPTGRQWVVAGATTIGRTSLLSVVNPTTVPAVVDLEIFTERGPVSAVGMAGIDVPAGAQRVIPIAGFVLEAESIAVRVTSSGGNVVASLQSSTIRTLEPGGIDLVTAAGDAGRSQVVPGVVIDDGVALAAIVDRGAGYEDAATTVRIVAPPVESDDDIGARILFVPDGMTVAEAEEAAAADEVIEGGEGAATAEVDLTVARPRLVETHLHGGEVLDVPVPNVGTGGYTVHVTATEPVLAAVRVTAAGTAGTDFAWVSQATGLADDAIVAVPDAVDPRIAIANPRATDAEVVVEVDGKPTTVTVPATGSVLLPVVGDEEVRLSGVAGLSAAIVTGRAGLLSVSPVQPPAAVSRPVTVYP